MTPDQQPATKQDLAELEARMDARFSEMDGRISEMETRIIDRLTEAMRDMQSEILRGLEAFARDNFARLHSVETRTAAMDQTLISTNDRITALEERVLNLEVRRPDR